MFSIQILTFDPTLVTLSSYWPLYPTQKKIGEKKKWRGGGGRRRRWTFLRDTFR